MTRYDSLPAFPQRTAAPPGAQLYGVTSTITASGNSAAIDTSEFTSGWLSVFVTSATGTTPSLTVYWEHQDAAGNWIVVGTCTAITSGPNYAFIALGGSSGYPMPLTGRIRWAVTGTTPSFAATTITLIGR